MKVVNAKRLARLMRAWASRLDGERYVNVLDVYNPLDFGLDPIADEGLIIRTSPGPCGKHHVIVYPRQLAQ